MKQQEYGTAYQSVRFVYDHSPGRSWARLNSALDDVLKGAITAHLTFLPGDFSAMRGNMAGHYWMGNSEGVVCGERYYSLAVKVGHMAACLAFEKYAGRPPALWCEMVKTPERLCIGSDFTWEGHRVSVTTLKESHLIACSYKWDQEDSVYVKGHYRKLVSVDHEKLPTKIKLGEVIQHGDSRKVVKRFKISYDELKAKRLELDRAQKAVVKEIQQGADLDSLTAILKRLNGNKELRKFDLEAIRTAVGTREKELRKGIAA